MKFNRWTVVAAAIFALMAADSFAQLGSIRGKILDEDGNPVGSVKCSIELPDGRSMSVTTKDNGQFTKGGVRAGMYTKGEQLSSRETGFEGGEGCRRRQR